MSLPLFQGVNGWQSDELISGIGIVVSLRADHTLRNARTEQAMNCSRMTALGGKRTFTFGASAPHVPRKFRLVGYAQVQR